MTKTTLGYGAWPSPLSPSDLGAAMLGFGGLRAAGEALYWTEYRPAENGRNVIMRMVPGTAPQTLTPQGFNARSRVHEYGGTPFVVAGERVIFSNFADQRLYSQKGDEEPAPLTTEDNLRYADGVFDAGRSRIVVVQEDHRPETLRSHGEARNEIAAVDLQDGASTVLFRGNDFVAYPRLSVDGRRLAWIGWDHPNMPWDTVYLYVADVDQAGNLSDIQILNGAETESVLQPLWAPSGELYFSADRSGYWSLYCWDGAEVRPVLERPADLGGPLWGLGASFFDILPDGTIVASYLNNAAHELAVIDVQDGTFELLDVGEAEVSEPVVVGERLFGIAEYPGRPHELVEIDPASGGLTPVRRAGEMPIDPSFVSIPERMDYETSNGERAHGVYYPPTNPDCIADGDEKPPLIVMAHGGPTGHKSATFQLDIQFWTTRGFAVFNVNYRGSTGFGRAYRQRLYKDWGIVDVEDAVNGALFLAAQGLADRSRLLIRGGSAGGYVVLATLAFHDTFAAGANYYGVSDMEALAQDTHKFESRYTDQLVGPYPEMKEVYVARSPIHHLGGFDRPLITFQGLEDEIVPPNQSEAIFTALKEKGVPTAYLTFAEEQHGFRKAENRERALEAELAFYGRVLGFTPAGSLPQIQIENLG